MTNDESHKNGGMRCLVAHSDELGPCIICEKCGQWLRPTQFANTKCPNEKVPEKKLGTVTFDMPLFGESNDKR